MSIQVTRDGQIVPIWQGLAPVAGRDVPLGYSEVFLAGAELQDEQVTEDLLELVKKGEVPGLRHFSGDAPALDALPVPDKDSGRGPAFDPDRAAEVAEERDKLDAENLRAEAQAGDGDGEYDPSEYTQEQVLNYLETADKDEVERVQAIEADGQNRKKIREFEPKEEE